MASPLPRLHDLREEQRMPAPVHWPRRVRHPTISASRTTGPDHADRRFVARSHRPRCQQVHPLRRLRPDVQRDSAGGRHRFRPPRLQACGLCPAFDRKTLGDGMCQLRPVRGSLPDRRHYHSEITSADVWKAIYRSRSKRVDRPGRSGGAGGSRRGVRHRDPVKTTIGKTGARCAI